MKRPFLESRHVVSGLCESLKTTSIYKNWIIEEIKAQLGSNPLYRNGSQSVVHRCVASVADNEDGESIQIKSRKQDRGSQSV